MVGTPDGSRHAIEHAHRLRELALAERHDWPALARYWITHGRGEALDAAIEVVNRRSYRDGVHWSQLAELLAAIRGDPTGEHRLPAGTLDECSEEEEWTVYLLLLLPRMFACELKGDAKDGAFVEKVKAGIRAATQMQTLARRLNDDAVFATVTVMIGRGCIAIDDHRAAFGHYDQAIAVYRELAAGAELVFQTDLAEALFDVGTAALLGGDYAAACDRYQQAVAAFSVPPADEQMQARKAPLYNQLGLAKMATGAFESAVGDFLTAAGLYAAVGTQSNDFAPQVADNLYLAGSAQNTLAKRRDAETTLTKARDWYLRVLRRDTRRYAPPYAKVLAELADATAALGIHDDAIRYALEAVEVLSPLQVEGGSEYLPHYLKAAVRLAQAHTDRQDIPAARKVCADALGRVSGKAIPRTREVVVAAAKLLHTYATCQSSLSEFAGAAGSLEECVRLYRHLGADEAQPDQTAIAHAYADLADAYEKQDKKSPAVDAAAESEKLYRLVVGRTPTAYNRRCLVAALSKHGQLLRDGHLAQAIESFMEAKSLADELYREDHSLAPVAAAAVLNLSEALRQQGDHLAALSLGRSAVAYKGAFDTPHVDVSGLGKGALLLSRAFVLRDFGADAEAREHAERALQAFLTEVADDPKEVTPLIAKCLRWFGTTMFRAVSQADRAGFVLDAAKIVMRRAHEFAGEMPVACRKWFEDVGYALTASGHHEQAIGCFKGALVIARVLDELLPAAQLVRTVHSLNCLGIAQRESGLLDESLASHREALALCEQLDDSDGGGQRRASAALNNLGLTEWARGEYLPALELFRRAVELLPEPSSATAWIDLSDYVGVRANLAGRYMHQFSCDRREHYRDLAFAALLPVCEMAERNRLTLLQPRLRKQIHKAVKEVYERLIDICVERWLERGDRADIDRAVMFLERCRARNLTDLFADEDTCSARVPPEVAERFRVARRKLKQAVEASTESEIAADLSGASGFVPSRPTEAAVEEATASYESVVSEIRAEHDLEFTGEGSVHLIDLDDLKKSLSAVVPTAYVYLHSSPSQVSAVAITREGVDAVILDELTDQTLWMIGTEWYSVYHHFRNAQELSSQGPSEGTARATAWAATRAGELYGAESGNRIRRLASLPSWDAALEELLAAVSEKVVAPIAKMACLRSVTRLVIVPHHVLNLMPLHACVIGGGEYLGERYDVVCAPSISVLRHCERRRQEAPVRVVVAKDPTGDLPFSRVEGGFVAACYPEASELTTDGVTKEELLREAGRCNVMHYCGHACFDAGDPLSSALVLGSHQERGKWLSLRDVNREWRMYGTQLVIISGCESGVVNVEGLDEFVSFPAGMLYAGARSVISALWPIDDLPAALLMRRFHQEYTRGRSISAALREAQRWLRDDIKSGVQLRDEILPECVRDIGDESLRELCLDYGHVYARRFPNAPPFALRALWASFYVCGAAWRVNDHDDEVQERKCS